MEKSKLAQQIRVSQSHAIKTHVLDAISDDDIIDAVSRCKVCGVKFDPNAKALAMQVSVRFDRYMAMCYSLHECVEENDSYHTMFVLQRQRKRFRRNRRPTVA